MGKYSIRFKQSALKEFKRLPKKVIYRILSKIEELKNDPVPRGSKKLGNGKNYRVRTGDYRIIYTVQNNELIIIIIRIAHRKDV